MSKHIATIPACKGIDGRRRNLLKTVAGVAAAGCVPAAMIAPGLARAQSAKFKYKLGLSLPDAHPTVGGLRAAAAEILSESKGLLDVQIFANGQLGGDAAVLSQLRSGGVEFFATAGLVWANLIPAAGLSGVAFAFPGYQNLWNAMDGGLGEYIRTQFSSMNLVPMQKVWDHGFRNITSNAKPVTAPADLNGLKIRVPQAPMLSSMFAALGAAPASITFGELYSALQTRVVDAQENPLNLIETGKLYEVQKFCSLTSHVWDGFWICANKRSWEALPEDLRQLASRTFDAHALKTRAAHAALDITVKDILKKQGMTFNDVDIKPFRESLKKAGYYAQWQQKMGAEAWGQLEKYTGKLI